MTPCKSSRRQGCGALAVVASFTVWTGPQLTGTLVVSRFLLSPNAEHTNSSTLGDLSLSLSLSLFFSHSLSLSQSVSLCLSLCLSVSLSLSMYACIYIYTHMSTCTSMHVYTYVYICTWYVIGYVTEIDVVH